MITIPAILSSVPRWSCSTEPRPVAVSPRAMKTAVKERQKTIAGSRTFSVERSPFCSSATLTPETAER